MKRWIGWTLALAVSTTANAFDTQTHAYITYQAFLNSNVGNSNAPALLAQLGIDRLDQPQPFAPYWTGTLVNFYFDNAPDGSSPLQYERPVTAYEWEQLQQLAAAGVFGSNASAIVGASPTSTLPIANWLMRGAIREDDLYPDQYDDGDAPDQDPYGPFNRVYNHFYDPINNRKFTYTVTPPVACPTLLPNSGGFCYKSVDWAMGTADAFSSLSADSTRHQHFSWADARNNYFQALIAERDANGDGVRSAGEREEDAEERLYRWATTFRALGDVVHLLEDTAQPQHTRNDRHDPHVEPNDQQGFEPFTNARLLGQNAIGNDTGGEQYVRSLSGAQFARFGTALLGISSYPPPTFTTQLRYFTTRLASDSGSTLPDSRYGMADYSNRGFFTRGTVPGSNTALAGVFAYSEPDPTLTGFTPTTAPCDDLPQLENQTISCKTYSHTVPDPTQPGRSDVTTAQPLVASGMWADLDGGVTGTSYTLTPAVYQATGNLVVPRAIAYSAGIINFFFRGKLAVTAPPDKIVAVLNQGAQHTMNPQGYPCVGTATNDGCPIFGFQSVRVSVQNVTPTIMETGSAASDPQALAATVVGNPHNPSFTGPQLVAVARYHRNTCYKPDMTGERQQAYASSPTTGLITEPTCAAGQVVRTAYPEVSVSQSAAVTAATLNGSSSFEVHFDFSADPIPVNATDLFIQVVYRGPIGTANAGGITGAGLEPDAIAVGTLDVREPTFAAFWNNTDYFWNGSNWMLHNSVFRNEGVKDFWACAGGFPVKMIFQNIGGTGTPSLIDPVSNSGSPGIVRLSIVFPPPDFPTQGKNVQGTPVHYPSDTTIAVNEGGTQGQWRQASMEDVPSATLTAPVATCNTALPTTTPYWCFDPIQKRRGQLMGTPDLPLALVTTGASLSGATDVDAVPLPAFSGLVPLATGTVLFDTATTLASCSAQPAVVEDGTEYQDYLHAIDVLEEARDLGVSDEHF